MSSIAGILDLPINEEVIKQMLSSMKKRGPGENSVYYKNGKCMLYSAASEKKDDTQPLILDWAGERFIICFDGFIYNRDELHNKLLSLGYPLETDQDAELMLYGYICWQDRVLDYVNGDFAIAILSQKQEKVFLARDRLGVKPLFYMNYGNGLLFASEMKTILSFPGVEAQLDVQGICEILLIGPGRTPGSGVFCGIKELEPGCYGVFQGGNLQLHRYWQLRDKIHTDSFEETVEKVRYLVTDAIHKRMKGNSPVGTMLSGGLDSSIVSAICAREYDACGIQLDTFSLDYQDNDKHFKPGRFQPNSDSQYIRIMQEMLDSQHHWTVLTPDDLVDGICDATIARDLPGMGDVDTSLLAFSKKIQPYTSVVLSGECADEIFGGYPWYRDPEMRDSWGFPWAKTTDERTQFIQDWVLEKVSPKDFIYERYSQTIDQSDILPENSVQERRIKEIVNLNTRWFMQTLLERGDRMGSYCGLDIRVPFCDYRIAEYLYTVPWTFKDHKGQEKGLLRQSMDGILPHSVLYRKKSPFPKTHDPQYLDLVSKLLQEVIRDKNAPIFQFVRKDALDNLIIKDFAWPWYGQLMQRPQTIVYMLQINYWLKHYSVKIV